MSQRNPNVASIALALCHRSEMSPKELSASTGLSIDAVRRACKAGVKSGRLIKIMRGRLTYYGLPPESWVVEPTPAPEAVVHTPAPEAVEPKVERKRAGKKVWDLFVDGKRLPKDDRFGALIKAGLSTCRSMEILGYGLQR